MADYSLVKKAKAVGGRRRSGPVGDAELPHLWDAELRLMMAYLDGDVTNSGVAAALGKAPGAIVSWMGCLILAAVRSGQIKVEINTAYNLPPERD